MTSLTSGTFNHYVERYLGMRLPDRLADLVPFSKLTPDAKGVALRLLDGDERIAEALRKGELGDLTHGDLEQRAAQLQVIGNQ